MSFLTRLNRPEYVFRPRAALRRLRLGPARAIETDGTKDVVLPWAQPITVFPDEMGRVIRASGVFDVCVTETIHRLLDPGEVAVDVGAHIGYLTSLMATDVGPDGLVLAYEPHPRVFELHGHNVARWNTDPSIGAVEARRLALSSEAGRGRLRAGADFESHTGLASLREPSEARSEDDFDVSSARLDDLLGDRRVGLLKIDVEGHEHAVLQGAESLLGEHRVRDIVFEDDGVYPTPAMVLLERHGMTLFTLDHSLFGLRPHPVQEGPAPAGWPGPNYLATVDPARAMGRLRSRGWKSLALGIGRRRRG